MEITASAVMPPPAVNGPEDDFLDWHGIDWATCEENVRRHRGVRAGEELRRVVGDAAAVDALA